MISKDPYLKKAAKTVKLTPEEEILISWLLLSKHMKRNYLLLQVVSMFNTGTKQLNIYWDYKKKLATGRWETVKWVKFSQSPEMKWERKPL